MKYVFLLALLATFNGFSQGNKHFVVKTNSLHYLVKTGFNVSTEIQTKANHSLNFTFETGNSRYNYVTDNRNKFIVFVAEKRNYSKGSKAQNNLSGFFFSPYLKYRYKDKNLEYVGGFFSNGAEFKAHSLGGGATVGYQNFIYKRIAVEAKIGLGAIFRITSTGETKPTLAQPDGILGLSFGFKI